MGSDSDFFHVEKKNLEPREGRILISDPFLNDLYFRHSIVLLTEHNQKGTVGFVLNRPVNLLINDILSNFPSFNAKVSIGGPVSTNTIHYIHSLPQIPECVKVLEGIYWGGNLEYIKEIINAGKMGCQQIRFFLGYSGWQPKQLDNELSQNAWIVENIDPDKILDIQDTSWKNTLSRLGSKYKIWANFPENPGMN
ncbi:MAG: YqgE/AlgH family protein [Bacteroidota bacterium]|nr:YqgE/AlgH family protein [Bacteroidota bacterium]MDP4272985.1 YqgE/AlgH family protein [Bacteroidota bacterium]